MYNKAMEGIQVRTFGGGLVTLICGSIVLMLFLSELVLFCSVNVRNRMSVDTEPVRVLHESLMRYSISTH